MAFSPFPRLPLELQFLIWKTSVNQSPPRVFELHDIDPDYSMSKRGDEYINSGGRYKLDPTKITIADVTLYKCSTSFERPLLGVDRASRQQNLRHYRLVKFQNADVYMNMDVDTMFLGANYSCRNPTGFEFQGTYHDPFWKNVKHLAFGLDQFDSIFHKIDDILGKIDDYAGRGGHIVTAVIKELQQFTALETFTLVLDGGMEEYSFSCKSQVIIFGDARQVLFRKNPRLGTTCLAIRHFREEWQELRLANPHWTVPKLHIKSISRGGRLHPYDSNDEPWFMKFFVCESRAKAESKVKARHKRRKERKMVQEGEKSSESCSKTNETASADPISGTEADEEPDVINSDNEYEGLWDSDFDSENEESGGAKSYSYAAMEECWGGV